MALESYAFIYDDLLTDRRFERCVSEIEAKLTSLDIQGRVARLTLFRNAKELIENMVRQGVSTVVVLGNDQSLGKIISSLPDASLTLGYLPVCDPSKTAEYLGIPVGADACDILAARFVETLDLGKVGDRYFLTDVELPNTNASVDINGQYRVSALNGGKITIRNLGRERAAGGEDTNAKDGLLDVLIEPRETSSRSRWAKTFSAAEQSTAVTHMQIEKGEIRSAQSTDVFVDGLPLQGSRFKIEIVPHALRIITGRTRRAASILESGITRRGDFGQKYAQGVNRVKRGYDPTRGNRK